MHNKQVYEESPKLHDAPLVWKHYGNQMYLIWIQVGKLWRYVGFSLILSDIKKNIFGLWTLGCVNEAIWEHLFGFVKNHYKYFVTVLQNGLWSKQIKKELIDLSLFGKSSMNISSLAFFRSKRWLQWLCVRVPGYADCCIYLDEAASALVCGGKTRLGGRCSAAKPLISALNHFRGQSSTDSLRQQLYSKYIQDIHCSQGCSCEPKQDRGIPS